MRPPSLESLLAAALGCAVLLVVSCVPTEVPREVPGEAALAFDVQGVIRDVTAQAGPTFAPEVPVDSPVYSTAAFIPRGQKVAFAGGIYLVVWSFEYTNEVLGRRHQIMATRVRASDGAVLDPGGVVLALNVNKEPHPAVASDGTNFLVAWEAAVEPPPPYEDPYNRDSSIFARRVSATTGALLDSQPIRVSRHWGQAVTPAIAFDGSHYLVVWSRDASAILGARVRASDGVVVDPSELVLCATSGGRFFPAVAFSEGHYLVAWQDYRTNHSAIYGTRVRASDGAVLEPSGTRLDSGFSNSADYPVIAASEGTFLVAWLSSGGYVPVSLEAVRVAASTGLPRDSSFLLSRVADVNTLSYALVSAGTHFQLMWSEYVDYMDRDVFSMKIPIASGNPFESRKLIAFDAYDETLPALAMGDHQLMAVWFAARGARQVLALRMDPTSLVALDEQPLLCSTEANAQLFPAVAKGTSNTLVVWADSRNRPRSGSDADPYDIYGVRVRNSDGVVLDSTPIPIARAAHSQTLPVVAFDGSNYLVGWMSGMTTSSSHRVRGARVRASDGVVLDPAGFDISFDILASPRTRPALAFGGGAYLASWISPDSTSIQVGYIRPMGDELPERFQVTLSSLEGGSRPQPTTLSVAHASDRFLVVWDERRDGSSNIYGKRIQHNMGWPWVLDSVPLALNTQPGEQLAPSVASSGSAFLVAWLDQRSGADALYGTRVNVWGGQVLDGTGLALNTVNASKSPPSVVFDGSNYALTWSNGWPATPSLKLTRVNPEGALLDGTGQVITETSPAFHVGVRAEVAALGTRQFLVAYARADTGLRQPRVQLRWLPATQPNGASCFDPSECASGICNPAGVCCDRLCRWGACGGGVCTDPPLRITCPADPVAEAADASGALVSFSAQAEGLGPPWVSYSQYPGTRFALGKTPVTATTTDSLGQKASCAFQVHVRDTTAPALACPASVTARATSASGVLVSYPPATASDRVSAVTLGYSQGSGTHFALGTTAVTVTATDAAGNASTCGFDVTVTPPAPPQVTCPGDVRAEATSPSGSMVYYAPASARGTAPLALSYSRASGTRIALGTTPLTATVTDGLGRTATCVFQVHVRDTTEPSLSCPAPVTAEATSPSGASVTYPPATASDTVSPVTMDYSHGSGAHFAVGTTRVTVTATDASGNASTCGFDVIVRQSASSSVMTGASGPL